MLSSVSLNEGTLQIYSSAIENISFEVQEQALGTVVVSNTVNDEIQTYEAADIEFIRFIGRSFNDTLSSNSTAGIETQLTNLEGVYFSGADGDDLLSYELHEGNVELLG